ncbi:MAG: acyl-ACP thioesterase domain-containing protein [Bacilli bacterium]
MEHIDYPITEYLVPFELKQVDSSGNPELQEVLLAFQKGAADHVELYGFGQKYRERTNKVFVICREKIVFLRDFEKNKKYNLYTYPLSPGRIDMYREAYILDENGNRMAEILSLWVFIDFTTRRICKTDEVKAVQDEYMKSFDKPVIFSDKLQRMDCPENEGQFLFEYTVQESDLDSNNHMNNTVYFRILQNHGIGKKVSSSEVNFEKECFLGEKIRIFRNCFDSFDVYQGIKEDGDLSFIIKFVF